jgi:hypothetical protein
MPAAMDDKKTGTDPKAHTPAYTDGFSPNTEKLCHITRFSTKAVQGYLSDINATSSVTAQTNPADARSPKDLVKRVASNTSEFAGGVRAILEFLPVLMVAITEAYLKDVLVYAAGMDPTLMERSEQSAYTTTCLMPRPSRMRKNNSDISGPEASLIVEDRDTEFAFQAHQCVGT